MKRSGLKVVLLLMLFVGICSYYLGSMESMNAGTITNDVEVNQEEVNQEETVVVDDTLKVLEELTSKVDNLDKDGIVASYRIANDELLSQTSEILNRLNTYLIFFAILISVVLAIGAFVVPSYRDKILDIKLNQHNLEMEKVIEGFQNEIIDLREQIQNNIILDTEYREKKHVMDEIMEAVDILVESKDYDSAIVQIDYYLNKEDDVNNQVKLMNLKGYCFYKQAQYDKSINVYKKLIYKEPERARYHFNIGNCYFNQAKYKNAIESYLRALELNDKDPQHYYNLGDAYLEYALSTKGLSNNEKFEYLDSAISNFTYAISINGKYAKAYNNRANAYYEKKVYFNAMDDIKMAIEINPHDIEYQLTAVQISEKLKNEEDQKFYLMNAIKLDKIRACKLMEKHQILVQYRKTEEFKNLYCKSCIELDLCEDTADSVTLSE